jgi:hypothetical protein
MFSYHIWKLVFAFWFFHLSLYVYVANLSRKLVLVLLFELSWIVILYLTKNKNKNKIVIYNFRLSSFFSFFKMCRNFFFKTTSSIIQLGWKKDDEGWNSSIMDVLIHPTVTPLDCNCLSGSDSPHDTRV